MNATGWFWVVVQTLLFLLSAPLFAAWVKRVKCWLQNRRSPPLLQSYRDLRRLFSKQVVLAHNASIIFRITPYLVLGVMILSASITPFISINLPSSAVTDAIALTGFFAFARFFLALSALDIGTAFGGMGSSREMTISALAEPAMLMMVFTVAMVAGSTNLSTVMATIAEQMVMTRPSLWFAALGFLLVAAAETGRVPVDNPGTHLELTMIHEAMILEFSGRHLAMLEWAAQIKLLVYAVIAVNIFIPWGLMYESSIDALTIALLCILAKLFALGTTLAVIETVMAKMRLFRVSVFLTLAVVLSFGGMLSYIVLEVG